MAPGKRPKSGPSSKKINSPKKVNQKPRGARLSESQALRDRYKKLLENAKNNARKTISNLKSKGKNLGERGFHAWREVIEKQEREINQEAIKALRKNINITNTTQKTVQEIEDQLKNVITEYQNSVEVSVKSMALLTESVLGGKSYLTPKDLEKFMRLYRTHKSKIEDKIKKDPQLRSEISKLIKQLREAKPLTKPQLKKLNEMVNDVDMTKMSTLDNTKIGLFLNLMTPAQRTQFIRETIKSPKNAKHAPKIIDSLTRLGILEIRQGEALMKEAIAQPAAKKHLKKSLRQKLMQDFANGTYNRIQNKSLAEQRKVAKQFKENFYKNPAMRYLNFTSGLGMLAVVWGFLTTSLNLIVNRGKLNKQAMWGLAAMGIGVMATQKGRQTDRRSSHALDPIGFNSVNTPFARYIALHEKSDKRFEIKKASYLQTIAAIYKNHPLHQYMQEGGFKTWHDEYQSRKIGQSHLKKENIYQGITSKKPKFKVNKNLNAKYVDYDTLIRLEGKRDANGKGSKAPLLKRALKLMPGINDQQRKKAFNSLLKDLEKASKGVPSLNSQQGYDGMIAHVRKAYGLNS